MPISNGWSKLTSSSFPRPRARGPRGRQDLRACRGGFRRPEQGTALPRSSQRLQSRHLRANIPREICKPDRAIQADTARDRTLHDADELAAVIEHGAAGEARADGGINHESPVDPHAMTAADRGHSLEIGGDVSRLDLIRTSRGLDRDDFPLGVAQPAAAPDAVRRDALSGYRV